MILNGNAVRDAFFQPAPPRPAAADPLAERAGGPVFSLLLRSYVPGWPGVLCSYGVLRIGAGRYPPSRQ